MNKEEIQDKIINSWEIVKNNKSRNNMGVLERYYDPYFLIRSSFTNEEIRGFNEETLNALFKLADSATEIFY